MKLEDVAKVSEVAGTIAIIATLIVLVIEVRGNTQALQAGNRQSISSRIENLTMTYATNPELQQLLRSVDDPAAEDPSRIYPMYNAVMRLTEEAYLQWQEGGLDEGYFRRIASASYGAVDYAHFRAWLRRNRNEFDPGFVSYSSENFEAFGETGD